MKTSPLREYEKMQISFSAANIIATLGIDEVFWQTENALCSSTIYFKFEKIVKHIL